MAYYSSTEAATVANPPLNLIRGLGNQSSTNNAVVGTTANANVPAVAGGNGLWYYSSTDASSDIEAATGYFTDGKKLGMRNGDVIMTVYGGTNKSTSITMSVGVLVTTNSTAGFSIAVGANIHSS